MTLAAYAYDVVIIAETKDSLKRTTEMLSEETGKIGLIINENKTKFMIVSRRKHPKSHITISHVIRKSLEL
jgi:hypothetical protein